MGFHFKDLISPVVAEVLDQRQLYRRETISIGNYIECWVEKTTTTAAKGLTTELGSYPEVMAMMGMMVEIMRTMEGSEAHQVRMMMVEIIDGEDRPTLLI